MTATLWTSGMAEISKKLGKNIKRLRLRRHMTQGDMCRKLKMDRSYMSAIEGGKKTSRSAYWRSLRRRLAFKWTNC